MTEPGLRSPLLRLLALAPFAVAPAVVHAAPYDDYRAAAASYVKAEDLVLRGRDLTAKSAYDVIHCLVPPATVGEQPVRTTLMVTLAIEAAVTRADLLALGYPAAVIEVHVGRWEKATLAAIARSADTDVYDRSEALARGIEIWRRTNAPRLRRVIAEGGCGAGEVPVRFDLRPNGRLALIPRFYFAACQARGIDPYDRRRCAGWGEVVDGRDVYLSGNYAYAAAWADGRSRRGDLRIDPGEDETPGPPIIVTPER